MKKCTWSNNSDYYFDKEQSKENGKKDIKTYQEMLKENSDRVKVMTLLLTVMMTASGRTFARTHKKLNASCRKNITKIML